VDVVADAAPGDVMADVDLAATNLILTSSAVSTADLREKD
jgi:hypothetical protein